MRYNFANENRDEYQILDMGQEENETAIFYRCNGANCRRKRGNLLENNLKKYRLMDAVKIYKMGCNDKCEQAPVIHLHPGDIWFSEKDSGSIIREHLLNNKGNGKNRNTQGGE